MMKSKFLLLIIFISQLVLSCKKDLNHGQDEPIKSSHGEPRLKIAIVSDIHYMHPSLFMNGGENGIAFKNYLDQDPKLVQYSDPIFRKVIGEITAERPDILLVPGDITKDGEKISHEAMAGFLHKLSKTGMKVYVVPGNHDINNAKAKKYIGDNDYPVEITSATDFKNIYKDFGYKNAIARDPNSLSYVVQPHAGFRIIGIDANKYEEFGPAGDIAAGRIKPATLTWILAQLEEAKRKNIVIFAMMHHNLVEHYAGQSQLDPGYVIDDWQQTANTLMNAGLKIIFTGHYHANDISAYEHEGNTLYDIQTGSLVTAPSPYRIITVKKDKLDIVSKTVKSIDVRLPGAVDFPTYANSFLSRQLDGYFTTYLNTRLGAPPPLASYAAPLFRNGIMAHFAGDEKMPPDQRKEIDNLATMSQQLADIVTILWTDLSETDNKNILKWR